MDIPKWLHQTVLPEPPPSPRPVQQPLPAPLLAAPRCEETRPRERRRPERGMSDSSILDARPVPQQPSPIGRQAGTVDSADDSSCSHAHRPPARSSPSSTSSHRYARRPRRRTRPERYEPAPRDAKERGTRARRHARDESKKSRRKSRRPKAGNPGVGLVHSFHASNVAQDRLTLKPHSKLGLFNKGRVSSPVKGRGLPDLVFSEMKFLQKHKDSPDPAPHATLPKNKKRKIDDAHSRHDDISAYFTSLNPVLAARDVNLQANEGILRQSLPGHANRTRRPSSVADRPLPTIEVPSKASCLGSESRSRRHTRESFVSWSESVRAPCVTPGHVHGGSIYSHAPRASISRPCADAPDALHSNASLASSRHLTQENGDRFQVSSSLPANRRSSRTHSFPQRICSPKPDGEKPPEPHRTADALDSPSSVPVVRPVHSKGCRGVGPPPAPAHHVPEPTEDMAPPQGSEMLRRSLYQKGDHPSGSPRTSSSLDRLLRQCDSAFDEYRRDAANSQRANTAHAFLHSTTDGRNLANASSLPRIRSLPTVRFSGMETVLPPLPEYAGPGIYEQQERGQSWDEPAQHRDMDILREHYIFENNIGDVDGEVTWGLGRHDRAYQEMPQTAVAMDPDGEAEFGEMGLLCGGQDSGPPGPSGACVAGRRFWRPNKLY